MFDFVLHKVGSRFPACVALTALLTVSSAGAQTQPLRIVRPHSAAFDRMVARLRLPRMSSSGSRVVAAGTPYSSTYYKLTNITALVHGYGGIAYAVNDDGRIAYTDFGGLFPTAAESAYIVNNGGTFGQLVHPKFGKSTALAAFALNENAQVVGGLQTPDPDGGWFDNGDVAWNLDGATHSTVAYFGFYDQQWAYAVNDYDVAVGSDGAAELFESSSSPNGKTITLRGLQGKTCYDSSANAINDAGEIIGSVCGTPVRFSTTGYAQRLPITTQNVTVNPEAINQAGDIAGCITTHAFLYRNGRTSLLPLPAADRGKVGQMLGFAINANDDVVGSLYDQYGDWYSAFLYHNGRSYDLNALIPPNSGWQIVGAFGVNDHGEIVGDAYYKNLNNLYGISLKPPQ